MDGDTGALGATELIGYLVMTAAVLAAVVLAGPRIAELALEGLRGAVDRAQTAPAGDPPGAAAAGDRPAPASRPEAADGGPDLLSELAGEELPPPPPLPGVPATGGSVDLAALRAGDPLLDEDLRQDYAAFRGRALRLARERFRGDPLVLELRARWRDTAAGGALSVATTGRVVVRPDPQRPGRMSLAIEARQYLASDAGLGTGDVVTEQVADLEARGEGRDG